MKPKSIENDRILTYGLSESQKRLMTEALPAKTYCVLDIDDVTDLIVLPAIAIVMDASALNFEDREMFFQYCTEVGEGSEQTIFWIGTPKPPRHLRTIFKCFALFEDFAPDIKYHFLSAHKKCKKAYEFSTQLSNCLRILKEIHLHPGIRTQDLANVAGVSVRTTQRYIRALQDAGEWIEYDEQKRGWYLQHGKTPLLDF